MAENVLLPSENSFKRLLQIIKENESNNGHQFYIESYCQTTPLFEINSNLLSIEFDKLITIHSKIIPKNILWSSLVDSRINQIDFKDNYKNILEKIGESNFESVRYSDVKYENYRLLFHYFKDIFSNDFISLILVIKGTPENPMDIINFDVSIEK